MLNCCKTVLFVYFQDGNRKANVLTFCCRLGLVATIKVCHFLAMHFLLELLPVFYVICLLMSFSNLTSTLSMHICCAKIGSDK